MDDPHAPPGPMHESSGRAEDASLGRALALVRFLRERCPWDARQDPLSLRPYLLEEAHEVADAVASGDDEALLGELGDLLLNVAFQIVLAEERGAFDAADVVRRLEEKMEARHPHVYGDAEAPPDWEEMKVREREAAEGDPAAEGKPAGDPFTGVPAGLEPLSRAMRVQERMSALGFDWPDVRGPLAKVREETTELERLLVPAATDDAPGGPPAAGHAHELPSAVGAEQPPSAPDPDESATAARGRPRPARTAVSEELGDLLFAVVNTARLANVHPSNALTEAVRKFERRCREMLALARVRGIAPEGASLDELDELWEETKLQEPD